MPSSVFSRRRAATTFHPASDAAAAPPVERPCTNCGAAGAENFCPRCGQETHDLHRSLYGIAAELLDAFAGWDGKIPLTLWTMVRHPGGLTTEFLAGRRARYLRPLRLYLTMSVAFFLSLTLVQRQTPSGAASTPARAPTSAVAAPSDTAVAGLIARHRDERGNDAAAWTKRRLTRGLAAIKAMPAAQRQRVMLSEFVAHAPNMIFLLLPVFAFLLRVLYLRRPVYYAEHFVFALHNHAFAYFAMTLAHLLSAWLSGARWLATFALLWMPVYFFVSMRRVYGGSRAGTALRFVTLGTVYGIVLFAATVVTLLVSIAALG